ncbi:hypothetical protein [Pseudoalteromonas ardens]|uniref:Serine/threonine protein kinase n=1 Tax=Pseudoalteromonas rubra TaxID=43658 RepID=A0A0L0ER83_9GAMM|nr:hypothetical protein [Pseudoalteromonas sp. R96]KNC66403.1 hypothetical protein AC626_17175 [Pseudoalteromonas rubra]MDK1310039.1 hypothetical protein [Pseudoalteromonas sp. R96]
MKLTGLFKVSLVTSALVLAGCGGDIEVTPTVNDTSVTDSNNTTTNNNTNTGGDNSGGDNGGNTGGDKEPGVTNPCVTRTVAGVEVQGDFRNDKHCYYDTSFASKALEITENITFDALPDGGAHVFAGALLIGENCDTSTGCAVPDAGPTLTIKPGATMAFASGEAIIRISRSAKIMAEGTAEAPITFTSANDIEEFDITGTGPQFADWGGIMINGKGLTNQCTNAARADDLCNVPAEGIVSHFGGDNNADDSGNIKYAKIFYAGSGPREGGIGNDLNSLTLNAVGSGSSFEFLHIHQGFDDGIEFFGGAANIKNIVVTDTQDDSIDIDAGWQGKAQFIYIKHGTIKTKKDVNYTVKDDEGNKIVQTINAGTNGFMGNNGFETDGEKETGPEYDDVSPSNPTIANVTVVTTDGRSIRDNDPSQAATFDDAIRGQYYNTMFIKEDNATNGTACLHFKDSDAAKNAVDNNLNFHSSVLACVANFTDSGKPLPEGQEYTTWWDNDGKSIILDKKGDVLAEDGFSTNPDSDDITVEANDLKSLNDDFFEEVDYVGAVSNADTSSPWYKWVKEALELADKD